MFIERNFQWVIIEFLMQSISVKWIICPFKQREIFFRKKFPKVKFKKIDKKY